MDRRVFNCYTAASFKLRLAEVVSLLRNSRYVRNACGASVKFAPSVRPVVRVSNRTPKITRISLDGCRILGSRSSADHNSTRL
jgi:hypothetical protein